MKYFQIYFRGTVSSGECCRTDIADYDGNSEAGYYGNATVTLDMVAEGKIQYRINSNN